jgi:hypothetical protein
VVLEQEDADLALLRDVLIHPQPPLLACPMLLQVIK